MRGNFSDEIFHDNLRKYHQDKLEKYLKLESSYFNITLFALFQTQMLKSECIITTYK